MNNVFGLWKKHDCCLPFAVRHTRFWHPDSFFVVTKIEPKMCPSGLYGKAWGYMFLRGDLIDVFCSLKNAGCYDWVFVDVSENVKALISGGEKIHD